MNVPQCTRCGERDRVVLTTNDHYPEYKGAYWCERCMGFLSNLSSLPGKHTPDDIGPEVKRKKYRKNATPRLTGEAQERGTPLRKGRRGAVNQ